MVASAELPKTRAVARSLLMRTRSISPQWCQYGQALELLQSAINCAASAKRLKLGRWADPGRAGCALELAGSAIRAVAAAIACRVAAVYLSR